MSAQEPLSLQPSAVRDTADPDLARRLGRLGLAAHEEQWVERYPDWWQPFVRWYVGQVAAAIMIPQHMVPLSAEQIVGRIAARFSGPIHSHRVDVQKQARWY